MTIILNVFYNCIKSAFLPLFQPLFTFPALRSKSIFEIGYLFLSMSAPELFQHLLVSKDGYVDEMDIDHAEKDNAGNIVVSGLIVVQKQDLGQIGEAIDASSLQRVSQHLEWTSRSVQARLGFDIGTIQPEHSVMSKNEMRLWAQFLFKPWEDYDGNPVENPLPPLVQDWLKRSRIACGRLFMRPLETAPLTGDQIQEEKERGTIDMNGAHLLQDGVVLPVHPHERYPLRHDLMDPSRLHDAFTGSGRGAIDAIQPRIREECLLQQGAYGIASTRCSLLIHRGILEPDMVLLRDGLPTPFVRHGTSRIWDAGKTTGMQHARHLEVQNYSPDTIKLSDYGVKMTVYPMKKGNGVVSRAVFAAPSSVRREGLNLDHYLRTDPSHELRFRSILDNLAEREDLSGVLIGSSGVSEIRRENYAVQQDQSVVVSADRYIRGEGVSAGGVHRSLCEYMAYMGDPRQRAILFARETPSPAAMRQLMERGVRTIVTDNVAQNDSKIYVSNSLLQHYRRLADEGLNLYLQTPTMIRKLWHYFFVDIKSMEKVQNTDVRFCIYCASAMGGDRLLELAQYRQFLEKVQMDYPNAAIVTGAAKNGAMHWANLVAREMGIVTIGVANHIAGQETTEDELDAGTFFDMDGFNARQELMARTGALPIVGPGAQGSEFEGSLERTQAKIGKSQMPPIAYIDPIGLGEFGRHLWEPVTVLEKQYSQVTDVPGGLPVQLTRSPYVAKLTTMHRSYLDAYESRIRPYMDDPLRFWEQCDVPETMIRTAMQRVSRDAQYTGLPVPVYLRPVLDKLGIE
jgi:predicted Rossmann-fold nucleotide-binding protein